MCYIHVDALILSPISVKSFWVAKETEIQWNSMFFEKSREIPMNYGNEKCKISFDTINESLKEKMIHGIF